MKIKKILAIMLVALLALSAVACGTETPNNANDVSGEDSNTSNNNDSDGEAVAGDLEPITYNFLHCWNGGAFSLPDGWGDGEVAKKIQEETGVHLVAETITSSETEKLATIFASGDVPDITNAPFWSTNPGGEGEQIKRAALDGMLLGLNEYIDQFPNVERAMTENINEIFRKQHLENKDFDGERYVIPNKPMDEEDTTNWAYGVFARKDILEDLGVEPEEVTNADELYDLLVKIKEGNYVDINDKPVIPAGNWHDGWSYQQYQLSFEVGGQTGWDMVDGKITHGVMLQNEIDKTLYMRKLVSEGLYDAEALTQTDTMGKEKMATGRVATQGCHWPHMNDFFESTLYLTNPEMEYVTLGPFVRQDGTNPTTLNRRGAYGFGALILSSEIEEPERALGLIDYLTSDEGWLLAQYGIEGKHYNMEDDIPVRTDEWKETMAVDQQTYFLEGFGYQNLAMDDRNKSYGWDENYNKPGFVKAREVRPLEFFDGQTVEDIAEEWPGREEYDEIMATSDYGNILKVAITASSDEEAISEIEAYRSKMIEAGYEEMQAYVQEALDNDPDILY